MYKFYKKSQNFRALSLSISRERDKNVRGFFGDFSLWVYSQQTCTFTMLTFKLTVQTQSYASPTFIQCPLFKHGFGWHKFAK